MDRKCQDFLPFCCEKSYNNVILRVDYKKYVEKYVRCGEQFEESTGEVSE